jgi:hypothetical protein
MFQQTLLHYKYNLVVGPGHLISFRRHSSATANAVSSLHCLLPPTMTTRIPFTGPASVRLGGSGLAIAALGDAPVVRFEKHLEFGALLQSCISLGTRSHLWKWLLNCLGSHSYIRQFAS